MSALTRWLVERRATVLVVAALVLLVAGYRTVLTYAQLRSDLEELLPENAPSVAALATARERLPGLRHLGVVVSIDDPAETTAALRFVDALEARVKTYPRELVTAVRSGVGEERRFAETYALQLMEPGDVKRLREAVEARRDWQVARATGQNLLDDEEDPAPSLPLDELREKYEARHGGGPRFPNHRFVSADGRTAVMVVQSTSTATSHGADQALFDRVRDDVAALGFPEAFGTSLRVGYAGDVATRVEETAGLEADLGISGLIVLVLVVGSIVWFYRSVSAVLVLGVPLLLGTTLSFALAALPPLSIRYLNSNTAFLASIIVGNGINGGIVMLARFREELGRESDIVSALDRAMSGTWAPTLGAALAAAAAYGSLVFTDFRGFAQFGWIGGIGMVVCWASMVVVLPPLASLFAERLRPRSGRTGEGALARLASRWVERAPRLVLALSGAALIGAIAALALRQTPWLETDFSKLRRRDSWEHGERYWAARMDATLQRYLTPTVVLAPDATGAARIEARLRELARVGGAGGLIASVRGADEVLPSTREAALLEARALARALTPRLESELASEDRRRVRELLSDRALTPLAAQDVPSVLAAGLRDTEGRIDRHVVVSPRVGGGTWDADRMRAFAHDLREAAALSAPPAAVAGSLLLSADLVDAMRADGPRATLIALAVVLLVTWLSFRRAGRLALASVASVAAGVCLMLAVLVITGEKVNFCNFVALPITFGIGADYSINVLSRWQASGGRDVGAAVASTGGAVALCSLTTIIGFGSLLVAQNRALHSFGVLAVAGELTCLVTAVLALPAALVVWGRHIEAPPPAWSANAR